MTPILLDHLLFLPLVIYTTFLAFDQEQLRQDIRRVAERLHRRPYRSDDSPDEAIPSSNDMNCE